MSTPVFNMLLSLGFGAHLKATISGDRLKFVGFAFVDDADLVEIARSTVETVQEVTGRMQGSLTAWEGGLRATGSAIIKSHWFLIVLYGRMVSGDTHLWRKQKLDWLSGIVMGI